jgi:hypothetical protein
MRWTESATLGQRIGEMAAKYFWLAWKENMQLKPI